MNRHPRETKMLRSIALTVIFFVLPQSYGRSGGPGRDVIVVVVD